MFEHYLCYFPSSNCRSLLHFNTVIFQGNRIIYLSFSSPMMMMIYTWLKKKNSRKLFYSTATLPSNIQHHHTHAQPLFSLMPSWKTVEINFRFSFFNTVASKMCENKKIVSIKCKYSNCINSFQLKYHYLMQFHSVEHFNWL